MLSYAASFGASFFHALWPGGPESPNWLGNCRTVLGIPCCANKAKGEEVRGHENSTDKLTMRGAVRIARREWSRSERHLIQEWKKITGLCDPHKHIQFFSMQCRAASSTNSSAASSTNQN
jgi:hypothetical protein